jgi:hypothetical protein
MQQIQLNIIPFNPPAGKQTFAFYKQKQEGYFPVFKDDLQGLLDDKFTPLELLEFCRCWCYHKQPFFRTSHSVLPPLFFK